MTVLGIIPARGGSKRISGKNLALLAGKPLLVYSVETCMQAKTLDRFVVSSDDDDILAVAESICPGLGRRRPAHLAQDTALVYDTVMHVLAELEAGGEGPYEIVALIQCTSPLTTPADIDGAVNALIRHPEADSAATIVQLDHYLHPAKLKRLEDGWLTPWLTADQAVQPEPAHLLEKLYVRNGSAYVSRRATLERGDLMGARCRGYLMPPERSIDINEPIDLALAEFLLSNSDSQNS